MKFFATILLLAVAATCISAEKQTVWGDVLHTRILLEQKVEVPSKILKVQERTVTYRSVSVGWACFLQYFASKKRTFVLLKSFKNGAAVVRGIMHLDYKTQSSPNASIVEGGLNQTVAGVKIVSERGHGINSVIRFYG